MEDESAQDRVTGADIELCRILLQKLQKGEFKITRHPCLVGWGGNDFHMLVEKKEWAIPPEVLEHFDGVKLAQVSISCCANELIRKATQPSSSRTILVRACL